MKANIQKNEIKFRGDIKYPWRGPFLKREKDSHKKGRGKKNVFILRTRKTELNLKEIRFNKRP